MNAVPLESSLEQHLMHFARYLRQEGLGTGIQEVLDVLEAASLLGVPSEQNIKYATRTLFCNSKQDNDRFDLLFDNFWKGDSRRFRTRMSVSSRLKKEHHLSSLIWLGAQAQSGLLTDQQSKEVSGAAAEERLRSTDFSKLSAVESEELEKLARKLWQEINRRLSRRLRDTRKAGKINFRRTIRRNISAGGNMWNLAFKNKKIRKPRLVVFLDVSGSMDKYSFYLLRFIYAIKQNFGQLEAFLFSTRLDYISDVLRRGQMSVTLEELSDRVQGWSSGTTIGSCLKEFNRKYAKYILSRQSTVLIMSDGLDTGETVTLSTELELIAQRARKLIWLNPLKGMKDYQPLAKGMQAALPMIDVFSSAHNLESLLELEKHMYNVQ